MKRYLIALLFIITMVPSVAFASWYNPLSWFNDWTFHKKKIVQQVQIEPQITPDEKINELQKQVNELKKQKDESTPKESSKSSPITAPKKAELLKPKISTDGEITDLTSVIDNAYLQLNGYFLKISSDYDTLLGYSSYYNYEVSTASALLNSLGDDIKNYMDKLQAKRSEIVRIKYVDKNYWSTYGIPEIALKQKEFKDKYNKIIKDFNNSINDKRSSGNYSPPSYPSYNYQSESSGCASVEQKIRDDIQSSGGMATESQIQAMLRAKGC